MADPVCRRSVLRAAVGATIAMPFAAAGLLTVLISCADRLHLRLERVAGLGFLFASPWGWLLDWGSFPETHNHWIRMLAPYIGLLWVPALLYSGCLWLFMRFARYLGGRLNRA